MEYSCSGVWTFSDLNSIFSFFNLKSDMHLYLTLMNVQFCANDLFEVQSQSQFHTKVAMSVLKKSS